MSIPIELLIGGGKWIVKKLKQPSSTSTLIGALAFVGVSNPEILANGITQIIAGVVSVYSVIKDDKSE